MPNDLMAAIKDYIDAKVALALHENDPNLGAVDYIYLEAVADTYNNLLKVINDA